jgi:hypothetical protein
MRFLLAAGVVIAAAISTSCGGGGGGGIPSVFDIVRVELPGRDPINIVVGQTVQFQLAGYLNGQRYTLTADLWTLNNGALGTLSQNGSFTATAPGNGTIGATWNGTPPAQSLAIIVRPAGLAGISGRVVQDDSGASVNGVQLIFYDAGNNEVGRANTYTNGNFLAQVPTTTTKVNFDEAILNARGFLQQWIYRLLVYQAGNGIPNCHATIVITNPPLVGGQTRNMPDLLRVVSNALPPPVPTGCGP